MKKLIQFGAASLFALCATLACQPQCSAQDAILAAIYGRGVHAYYAGRYNDAHRYLSDAINGGSKDPRAYYFRGIVATQLGRGYEAESDWRQGATLEAKMSGNPAIGRSLARFQGSQRLKLEQFRQEARFQALTTSAVRSDARKSELGIPAAPPQVQPKGKAAAAAAVTPPPTPPAEENPFKDDMSRNMAGGDAKVESEDALKADPFKDDAMAGAGDAAAPADAGGNPFGGAADAGADPFGGTGDAGADPFGGGGGDADPFGGGDDSMADPFGGGGDADPFGN